MSLFAYKTDKTIKMLQKNEKNAVKKRTSHRLVNEVYNKELNGKYELQDIFHKRAISSCFFFCNKILAQKKSFVYSLNKILIRK